MSEKKFKMEKDLDNQSFVAHIFNTILKSCFENKHMIEFVFMLCFVCQTSELYSVSQPKVSVILPVYDRQLWISFSLIHVLNQTLKSLEVICVDDGSLDQTLEILKFFAGKDGRIVVLHQKNCGLSCARNTGLAVARGEYVTFVDSDDWIESDAYEAIYAKAERHAVDLIIWGYFHHKIEVSKFCSKDTFFRGTNAARFILSSSHVTDCVWNKMYKRSLLKDNGVLFELNLKIGEDNLFNIDLIPILNSVLCITEAFYHYTYNPSGQSKSYTKDNLKSFLESSAQHSRCKWMTKADLIKLNFSNSWKQLIFWETWTGGRKKRKRKKIR